MTVADAAIAHTKKLMKLFVSLLRRGFSSSKCKTAAKMAVARIKLLKNKREVVVRQMRRDIALLLQSGQDGTARIRVEHVMREQILSIIAKQRECPADLKEGIASLIFAAPRCSEIPELLALKDIFEKKYGREFVSAATDLRPNCGVNRLLIDKLGKNTCGERTSQASRRANRRAKLFCQCQQLTSHVFLNSSIHGNQQAHFPVISLCGCQSGNVQFEDSKFAAEAAADSAMKAVAAAEVAAYMAQKEEASQRSIYDDKLKNGPASTIQETMHRSRSLPRSDHINDCDEETEMEEEPHGVLPPPNRRPPPVPSSQDGNARVHPKLPDYDELAARFEALKFKKSRF
ncbi:hypothetical protein K1719_046655 [Acacia pycnantha]|nr:hypothetical protein K1719_046655 [Acacia pycnantha]